MLKQTITKWIITEVIFYAKRYLFLNNKVNKTQFMLPNRLAQSLCCLCYFYSTVAGTHSDRAFKFALNIVVITVGSKKVDTANEDPE